MPAIGDSRSELERLVRRIQALKLEVDELRTKTDELRTKTGATLELEVLERALDRLRWRLAAIARRMATHDLDGAA
jgi:archaellum component FlaC